MSKKHRSESGDATAGHGGHGHRHATPGKHTLTQDLTAASTDAPGATGDYDERDDDLEPKVVTIIDMAATEGGTRLTIMGGKHAHHDLYSRASVVSASGKHLASAHDLKVLENSSSVISAASMDVIDTNDGKVKLEE